MVCTDFNDFFTSFLYPRHSEGAYIRLFIFYRLIKTICRTKVLTVLFKHAIKLVSFDQGERLVGKSKGGSPGKNREIFI